MKQFRLDRSAFSMGTHSQNAQHTAKYWRTKSVTERFAAAAYLNSVAYGYPQQSPARIDKTIHSSRKR